MPSPEVRELALLLARKAEGDESLDRGAVRVQMEIVRDWSRQLLEGD